MNQQQWLSEVAKGRIIAAQEILTSSENENKTANQELVADDLKVLKNIFSYLREKRYFHAQQLVDEMTTNILDKESLKAQIDELKTADRYINSQKPEEAEKLLLIMGSSPLEAEKLTLLGTTYVYLDNLDKAKYNLQEALNYDPKHYRAITNLANLNLEANHLDDAIAGYQQALSINDSFSGALHNLAVAYRKKGQLNQSVSFLKKAQRAKNKELREEARESLKSGENKQALNLIIKTVAAITIIAVVILLIRNLL